MHGKTRTNSINFVAGPLLTASDLTSHPLLSNRLVACMRTPRLSSPPSSKTVVALFEAGRFLFPEKFTTISSKALAQVKDVPGVAGLDFLRLVCHVAFPTAR